MNSIELPISVRYRFGWLHGARPDLTMFVLPFVLTSFLCFLADAKLTYSLVCSLLLASLGPVGLFHGGATWFHYLDKRNAQFYCSSKYRLMVHMILPVVVLLVSIVGWLINPVVTFFLYTVWTTQHLVQQNVGLLLLYRRPGDAQVNRTLEARSLQLSATAFFVAWALRSYCTLGAQTMQIITLAVCAINAAIVCTYLVKLRGEMNAGKTLNLSGLLFWGIAMTMWVPLLVGQRGFDAFILPLMTHWCQYIGLNWRLTNNKYSVEENRKQLIIQSIPPAFLFVLVCIGFVLMLIPSQHSDAFGKLGIWLQAIGIGFSMTHYFQDAFIWRFREPYLRETILPYVRSSS